MDEYNNQNEQKLNEAKSAYEKTQDEYNKIQEKIYTTGVLINYYEKAIISLDNASKSLSYIKDILNEYNINDINEIRECIQKLDKKVNSYIIKLDGDKNVNGIISDLKKIFDKLNSELEIKHKEVGKACSDWLVAKGTATAGMN